MRRQRREVPGGTLVHPASDGADIAASWGLLRARGVFNVKDPLFGAKGDGTTDDTAAIQAAITAAGSAGVVHLPAGASATTYLHTGLTVPIGVTLRGDGLDRTILKLKDAANNHCIKGTNADYVSIENLTVDGNQANQSTGSANEWRGIYFLGTSEYGRFRNVRVKNVVDHGWFFNDCQIYAILDGCFAEGCGSAGHISGGGSGGTGFVTPSVTRSCIATGNYLNGFKSSRARYWDCLAQNSTGGGGFENSATANTGQIYVGCRGMGNAGGGLRFVGAAAQIQVLGGEFSGNGSSGITVLNTVDRLTILAATIKNNGSNGVRSATVGKDGISILSSGATGPSNVVIDYCNIFDDQGSPTQDYGVYIEDAISEIQVGEHNIMSGHITNAVNVDSGSTNPNIRIRGFKGYSGDYQNTTSTPVTGTLTETDLMSTTLKAKEFKTGSIVRVYGAGTITGTSGTKTIRLYIGATSITVSSQLAAEAQSWSFQATIFMTGTTAKWGQVQVFENGGTSSVIPLVASISLSSDALVKVTGQLGNTGDTITQTALTVMTER